MHCEWLSQIDSPSVEDAVADASVVVGCSKYIAELVSRRYPDVAARTVYNGVDTKAFVPRRESFDAYGCPRILFVGRVSPEKGVHTLLEAFTELVRQFPAATLELVGPVGALPRESIVALSGEPTVRNLQRFYSAGSELYGDYLRRSVPRDLQQQVRFLGPLSREKVVEAYARSDIVVNPSLSESFGMSLTEAAAASLPAVATNVGGMAEVVADNETGLLVPPDDPAALAGAMATLAGDQELRWWLGRNGRARAERMFNWDSIACQTLALHMAST